MYLALQITGPQAAKLGQNASKIFSESGGTIGRAAGNDWILQDEERFISGRHVIIRCMGGMFSLEDVSTNGTFINGQTQAAGASNEPVILKNGDRIQIGDFEIYASIVEGESAVTTPPQAMPPEQPANPILTSPTGRQVTSPPTSSGASTIGPLDPLEMLGNAPPPQPAAAPRTFGNHSSAMSDHFAPPGPLSGGAGAGAAGGIPDDWDLTDFSASASGRGQAAAVPPPPPVASPHLDASGISPGYTNPPAAPQLDASGISPGFANPPAAAPAQQASGNAMFDQLMPLIVQGMMDVLKSRAEVKSQFRLALTTIKPVENNPLKFSPNVQDAMAHLFGAGKSGYLQPAQAFTEGFNDIKAHQLAMIAGMRAAFEHMLEQFSPEVLERHFEGGAKRGGIMGMANKVRYWDMYRELFNRITRDSDDNFRKLFGEEFASAYEAQMQKISRKM